MPDPPTVAASSVLSNNHRWGSTQTMTHCPVRSTIRPSHHRETCLRIRTHLRLDSTVVISYSRITSVPAPRHIVIATSVILNRSRTNCKTVTIEGSKAGGNIYLLRCLIRTQQLTSTPNAIIPSVGSKFISILRPHQVRAKVQPSDTLSAAITCIGNRVHKLLAVLR